MNKIAVILVLACLSISCGGYGDLEFDQKLQKRTDSLFSVKRASLRKEIDSLCQLRYDSVYQAAIDSIKQKQISEIQHILDR